jgi:hypothetical protein
MLNLTKLFQVKGTEMTTNFLISRIPIYTAPRDSDSVYSQDSLEPDQVDSNNLS